MSVLIIGSNGSMGRRYQTILSHLGQPYSCIDISNTHRLDAEAKNSGSIIIATPTPTHAYYLRRLCEFKKPILIEKPISTDIVETKTIIDILRSNKVNATMMMQYKMLVDKGDNGPSYYNYFRHGNDGIVYDCIQIIALAKGIVMIEETSPVWMCTINGRKLSSSQMDGAYVDYMRAWLACPGQDYNEILDAHIKTDEVLRSSPANN